MSHVFPRRSSGTTPVAARGGGVWITDSEGNRYLDAAAGGAVLNSVLDAGINFVDTSPDYGVSEERIGEFISHRRQEYQYQTQHSQAGEPVTQRFLGPGKPSQPQRLMRARKKHHR